MRTTADLNRIIDKIATNPGRRDSTPPVCVAASQVDVEKTSTSRQSSESRRPDATTGEKKRNAVDPDADEKTPPRLAVAPRTSERTRRRAESASASHLSAARRQTNDAKTEKNGKTVKIPDFNAASSNSTQRDEDAKRTQRRRQIDPTTCERDYSADEIEFMKALDDYKRASGRMFPTCSEILEVFKSLGYVKATRSEAADRSTARNARPNRVATPAFLSDDESDAFERDDAPALEIA
jgi:hypothetical protein